jgi:hypothetical protein
MTDKQETLQQERLRHLMSWRQKWTFLVYFVGLAIAAFLVSAIISLILGAWTAGAVSTAGTIVSGGATRWLLKQRKEAVAEEQKALDDINKAQDLESRRADEAKKAKTIEDMRRQTQDPLLGRLNRPS